MKPSLILTAAWRLALLANTARSLNPFSVQIFSSFYTPSAVQQLMECKNVGSALFPHCCHVTDGPCARLFSHFAPTNCSAAPVKQKHAERDVMMPFVVLQRQNLGVTHGWAHVWFCPNGSCDALRDVPVEPRHLFSLHNACRSARLKCAAV